MPPVTDRDRTAHLLRRFGLGASQAEVDFYGEKGYANAVEHLLNFEAVDEGFDLDLQRLVTPQGNVPLRVLQAWWVLRLCVTQRPLQEKLTLFWHDHFATSAQKVDVVPPMLAQNELFRTYGLGRFPILLEHVSKDPAMLYWLDNQFNVKGKPNENFAREVMELFTLGIGHYTELDIQEAARAFTGWTFAAGGRRTTEKPRRRAEYKFRPEQHDDGRKSVMGQAGNWNGDDVLRLLADQPQTARHLVIKLWEWFVYPQPAPALVERLTAVYRDAGLDTRALLRAIMLSSEFVSERAMRAIYKNPIDFCVATYRQLGVGKLVMDRIRAQEEGQNLLPSLGPINILATSARSMGMDILYPPDVAGWDGGAAWISSATMVERLKWAERLFGARRAGQPALQFAALPLFDGATDAKGLVAALLDLFDANLPDAKQRQLVKAAERALAGEPIGARNANAAALAVTQLLFGSPEFQFC